LKNASRAPIMCPARAEHEIAKSAWKDPVGP
jgi:hypothetical protein